MKQVEIDEHISLVNDEDYQRIKPHGWRVQKGGRNLYAVASIDGKQVSMHRFILGATDGVVVDHIDGNGLNNQRDNLRCCTLLQNFWNSRPRQKRGKTSRFKGIWYIKRGRCRRRWRASIGANGMRHDLGTFHTEEEAARAYDRAARRLHGEFARLNFPHSERATDVQNQKKNTKSQSEGGLKPKRGRRAKRSPVRSRFKY